MEVGLQRRHLGFSCSLWVQILETAFLTSHKHFPSVAITTILMSSVAIMTILVSSVAITTILVYSVAIMTILVSSVAIMTILVSSVAITSMLVSTVYIYCLVFDHCDLPKSLLEATITRYTEKRVIKVS